MFAIPHKKKQRLEQEAYGRPVKLKPQAKPELKQPAFYGRPVSQGRKKSAWRCPRSEYGPQTGIGVGVPITVTPPWASDVSPAKEVERLGVPVKSEELSGLGAVKKPKTPKPKAMKAPKPAPSKLPKLKVPQPVYRPQVFGGDTDLPPAPPVNVNVNVAAPAPSSQAPPSRYKFDQITGLISQGISAFGRNSSQQIASQNVMPVTTPVGPVTPDVPVMAGNTGVVGPGVGQGADAGQAVGRAVGGGLDGIVQFIQNNLVLVAGVGIGAFLLFRQPPGSSRKV